ncbi:helix-turn-helix domain-containing protein [Delftia acidovorans]|uniref:helix-turn-helix domain-containing protein n=2 Tax=Delftia acidovorans TaxID=80866 RepID=UPI000E978BD4|nr:hypothetical protein [Delftia acidovorans]
MGMANTFGARLIRARVAKGLSQSDLAASSGIAPAQISRYEADKNQPRLHILRKLAAALDIAPDRQLAGDDEADTEPADTAPTTQCKAHPRRYACVPQQAGGLVQPQPQRRDRSPPGPDPGRRLRRRAARCAAGAGRELAQMRKQTDCLRELVELARPAKPERADWQSHRVQAP